MGVGPLEGLGVGWAAGEIGVFQCSLILPAVHFLIPSILTGSRKVDIIDFNFQGAWASSVRAFVDVLRKNSFLVFFFENTEFLDLSIFIDRKIIKN